MRRVTFFASAACTLALVPTPTPAQAQESGASGPALEEIVVTSRRREESLQRVPDSLTAISAQTIENAGIQKVADFVQMTPNVTFRETFRQGASYMTVRGITTGQGGWAPVTYVVDGVPAGSMDAINLGALIGVERIEVLKGPQSALYGAGAIAGAINVVTQAPSDAFEGEGRLEYGAYDDQRAQLMLSGPLAGDTVKFRLDGFYRHGDGAQENTDGRGMNFDRTVDLRGRVIIDLAPVTIDLRAHHVDTHAGAAFQELLPPGEAGLALIEDYDRSPGIRRGIVGTEDVRANEASAKIDWDAGFATLTSITSYSKLKDTLFGSTSWDKPPTSGFCGPVGGAGEPPDCFQITVDDFEVFTQDLRLTSRSNQRTRWLFGASYLHREAPNLLTVGAAALDTAGNVGAGPSPFLDRTDLRHDRFKGVYGQVSYDITSSLEATVAVRYDENEYDSTQYDSLALENPIPTPDGIVTQRSKDTAVQPKLQLAYRWTDDVMTYATVAKGFRSGFYYSGNSTKPESTWNYELGLKSSLLGHRVIINAAVFHISYSDQQYTMVIPDPPYRNTSNIPESKIRGIELEAMARPIEDLTLGLGLGYTHARVDDGTAVPFTPELTGNLSAEHNLALTGLWELTSRLDYRYQASQYLARGNRFQIGNKGFVNLRLAFSNGRLTLAAYGKNLTDERVANEIDSVGFGYLRYNNDPRTYGGEVSLAF